MRFMVLCMLFVSLVLAGCDQPEPEDPADTVTEVAEEAEEADVAIEISTDPNDRVWEGVILVRWSNDPAIAPDLVVQFADGSAEELTLIEDNDRWEFEMPYHRCAKTQVMWLEPQVDTERLRATYVNRETGTKMVGLNSNGEDIEHTAWRMEGERKVYMFYFGSAFSTICIS